MRHRARALLSRPERLFHLADLCPGEVPDLHGELLQRRCRDGERRHVLRVPVALEDLAGGLRRADPEPAANVLLDRGVDLRVGAHRARDLAHRHGLTRPSQAVAIPVQLEGPKSKLVPEGRGLGVNAVGSAHHHGVPMGERTTLHDFQQSFELVKQQIRGLPKLEPERCVQQIAGGHAEVDPPSARPHRLRDALDEGGDVVVGRGLELVHALDGEGRPLADGSQVVLRDAPQAGPGLARQDLDPQPVPHPSFVGPDGRHLWKGVAGDHPGPPPLIASVPRPGPS